MQTDERGQAPEAQRAHDWMRTRLCMRRPWLDDLPEAPSLPAGATLRAYQPADCHALAALLTRAFGETWDEARVLRDLAEASDVERVYVVAQGEGVLATASARMVPERYPGSGYVHWVAADPAVQGRGLGTLVTLRVLQHFRMAGLKDAVLETNDFRLAAIRSYLRLGFVPEYEEAEDRLRWARVLPRLMR